MKKENGNDMPFKADEVNWDELSGIGIMKDELELSGEMDTILRGEKTKVMPRSNWSVRASPRYWKSRE